VVHELEVMQTLEHNNSVEEDVDQRDGAFRTSLVPTAWQPGEAHTKAIRDAVENSRSVEDLVSTCLEHHRDPCEVLLEYSRAFPLNVSSGFANLVKKVELRVPFPSQAASEAFRALVGLSLESSNPIFDALSQFTAPPEEPHRRDSEFSMEESESETLLKAARYLGFDLYVDYGTWSFESSDDCDLVEESQAAAVLSTLDLEVAQRFCVEFVHHVLHQAQDFERWMLDSTLRLLVVRFSVHEKLAGHDVETLFI
jgi:hypothetical protein